MGNDISQEEISALESVGPLDQTKPFTDQGKKGQDELMQVVSSVGFNEKNYVSNIDCLVEVYCQNVSKYSIILESSSGSRSILTHQKCVRIGEILQCHVLCIRCRLFV
ncbi:unnamed protein product [Choristocarpus tenellus]